MYFGTLRLFNILSFRFLSKIFFLNFLSLKDPPVIELGYGKVINLYKLNVHCECVSGQKTGSNSILNLDHMATEPISNSIVLPVHYL